MSHVIKMMMSASFLMMPSFNNKFFVFKIFPLHKVNCFFLESNDLNLILYVLLNIFDDINNIQNTGKAINNKYLHFQLLFLLVLFKNSTFKMTSSQEGTESCSFIGFVIKSYLGAKPVAGQKAHLPVTVEGSQKFEISNIVMPKYSIIREW